MNNVARICCNKDCGKVWAENDCLDFKHPTGARFCPDCGDVTEPLVPDNLIRCQRCVATFGADNARIATEHGVGILVPEYHLCAEHYLERFKGDEK